MHAPKGAHDCRQKNPRSLAAAGYRLCCYAAFNLPLATCVLPLRVPVATTRGLSLAFGFGIFLARLRNASSEASVVLHHASLLNVPAYLCRNLVSASIARVIKSSDDV